MAGKRVVATGGAGILGSFVVDGLGQTDWCSEVFVPGSSVGSTVSPDPDNAGGMRGRDGKSVLIYCPDLGGHRQIYCDVLTDFLLSNGFGVILAVAGVHLENELQEYHSPHIEQYRGDAHVAIVPVGEQAFKDSGRLESHVIRDLQRELEVDWTCFVDGDRLKSGLSLVRSLFNRPRLLGRNCAIFLDVGFMYYGIPSRRDSTFDLLRGLVWWLRTQLRENLFYRVVLRHLWNFDLCFFVDEYFVRRFDYAEYHYLPDIPHSFRLRGPEGSGYEDTIGDYEHFLRANSDRDVILYFGNAARRRGYDWLLKLTHDHPDLVFVHCGGHVTKETYDYAVGPLEDELRSSGRLFQFLDTFVTSTQLVDRFFSSTGYVLLPYRNHYQSSAILIQAIDHGKPVLVPDVGLMNSLVADNGIGATFNHLSYDDFESQFLRLRSEYTRYLDSVMEFRQGFTKDAVFAALKGGLGVA